MTSAEHDNDERGSAGRSLQQLMAAWQAWSGREVIEQAARRAEATGERAQAERLRALDDGPPVPAVEALAAQHEVSTLLAGWEWQTIRAAREEGATWAEIGRAVAADPAAARTAYLTAIDRQEQAAARSGWSVGMTVEQARAHRDVAGPRSAELRTDTPDSVPAEIETAIAGDDTEALAALQARWWDPDHQPLPTDEPIPYVLTHEPEPEIGDGVGVHDMPADTSDADIHAAGYPVTTATATDADTAIPRDAVDDSARAEPEIVRLECPECSEDAVEAPPDTRVPYGAHGQQVPRYAHPDGEPLCPVIGPCGYEPAQPREVLDEETARRAQLARWHADDHPDGDAAGDAAGVDR